MTPHTQFALLLVLPNIESNYICTYLYACVICRYHVRIFLASSMLRRRDVPPRAFFGPFFNVVFVIWPPLSILPPWSWYYNVTHYANALFRFYSVPATEDIKHFRGVSQFVPRRAEGGLQTNVMPVLNSQRKFALPKTRETIQENWHCGRLSYPKRHSCDNRKISHVNTVTFPLLSNAVGYPPRQIANEGRTSHWEVHSAFGRSGLSNSESCGA